MRDDPLARREAARETRGVRLEAVVIGAGAAGLAAAVRLKREGLRVAVLEARDRVGGRIETCRHTGGFAGTVHGALETGERAAEELLTLRKGARRRRPRPRGRGPRATDREARR
jgi:monoamine oxidase